MIYKILLYVLLICNICKSFQFAQTESDESLNCDYTYLETQLESVKTGNLYLKQRFEMMQKQMDKQESNLQDFTKTIMQSIQNLESKILGQYKKHYGELNDLISIQQQQIQTHFNEPPPVDDKWQIMSEMQDIVKDHDDSLKNIMKKVETVENLLKQPTWETKIQQLGDSISKNLTSLENIDKNLTTIKSDQITINKNIQQYLNQHESPKICLKGENQNLICTTQPYPTNCADFNTNYCDNNKCRIQNHLLYGSQPFLAACDDHTDGGGWTIIQRRINGSVDFYRDWSEYKDGFGNLDGEFFIGLEKLHALTTTLQPMEILIQLQDFNDTWKYAKYDEFTVGSETENYKLIKVGKYSGNATDSLSQHQGYNFTTKDRDNDESNINNCAVIYTAAWWYEKCFWSNLNGKYHGKDDAKTVFGICWNVVGGCKYSLKFVQMMIRPKKV